MAQSPGAISSRRIYENHVIVVDEDEVRYPDGSTGTLAIVRHPGASAVVPFLSDPHGDDPTVLLIRQYRHAAGGFLLEVPAGRFDRHEEPEACARRELLEETGCIAGTMKHLTTIFTTPGFSDERIHLFMATHLRQGESSREADEFIEPVTMTLSAALAAIERGEISDGKTVVALLFAAGYRTAA
jgi:ADP-ribose pyrophosphatase